MVVLVLLGVFLILVLVGANAFFVAAEFALVSVRDTRIQQLIETRRIGARTVYKLRQRLDEVLNAVQLGITLASLALGWIGEPILARMIESVLGKFPYSIVYAHAIAFAIAFSLITYLHVILGEVVPKSLALQRAERVALAIAAPMDVFLTITRPLLYLMTKSGGFVLRIFGSQEVQHAGVHSSDELKLIVSASQKFGEIPVFQEGVIQRALELHNITVREVMVPRPDIFSLPGNLTVDDALKLVVEEQHSRIPVYDPQSGPEHIVGVLYAKDLRRWKQPPTANPGQPIALRIAAVKISQIMHDVRVVPETKVLTELLEEFKAHKRHFAVVVDEFGSTAGVITLEDILGQLVGVIEDEFNVAPPAQVTVESKTGLVVEGSIGIRDVESQYQLLLPRDGGFETLAGFVLARMQKVPSVGDAFDYEGHRFSVEEMERHRIAKVKVEKLEIARMGNLGD
jgi:putative hemolysin